MDLSHFNLLSMSVGSVALTVLVAFGVTLLAVLLFGGWILVRFLRMVRRTLVGGSQPAVAKKPSLISRPMLRCPRSGCHGENAPSAKFCTRCGVEMTAQTLNLQTVKVRRSAVA